MPAPSLPAALPALPLRVGRVHEAGGPGALGFAAVICAQTPGALLWVRESWRQDTLAPMGLAPIFDPARLMLVQTANQIDSLAVAEEALKDGAVALVVMDITAPLDLREGRRLQLAAKEGKSTGLCLISEGMGSNAAETRWHCTPIFDPAAKGDDSTLMEWEIKKNKSGTIGVWHVRWDRAAHRLDLVSPAGK